MATITVSIMLPLSLSRCGHIGLISILLAGLDACSGTERAVSAPPSSLVVRLTIRNPNTVVLLGGNFSVQVAAYNAAGDSLAAPGGLTFLSRDPGAVSINSEGIVTGRKFGAQTWVVVLAQVSGRTLTDSMRVTVSCTCDLRAVVSPDQVTLRAGETVALRGRMLGCLGQLELPDTLRWRSSDVTVATVDSASGVVTARALGAAMISMMGRQYPASADAAVSVVP